MAGVASFKLLTKFRLVEFLCVHFNQIDTVNRAGLKTQLTAGAVACDHGVHEFSCPDDGINWTGSDALIATDAQRLIYHRFHFYWLARERVDWPARGCDGFKLMP